MKFENFKSILSLQSSFSGYFWGLTLVFKVAQNKNWCDCHQQRPYSAAKKYLLLQKFRRSHRRCSVKEGLRIFKNTYFEKHLWTADFENQCISDKFRSSHPEVFCKKDVLRNFPKFSGKHLRQSLFLIRLQAWDSCTGVSLWILWNF